MKPITGLIRKRAKAGMTIPAAPRMTSASLSAVVCSMPPAAMIQVWPDAGRLSRIVRIDGPQNALVKTVTFGRFLTDRAGLQAKACDFCQTERIAGRAAPSRDLANRVIGL